ncbi:hypothetical protein M5K25_010257 [Dendrobium thyrsiflorum]|uniref:Uncharacterized protein n=1 Tax=Dendrobium thyrsiflorum TaxID=117978 RepID=A0ABD0UZU7_DENTH
MDTHIPEEYVVRRRWEKSAREVAGGIVGGGGSFRQRNEERKGRELWTALIRGIEERKVEISSGGSEKAVHDMLFGIFSA